MTDIVLQVDLDALKHTIQQQLVRGPRYIKTSHACFSDWVCIAGDSCWSGFCDAWAMVSGCIGLAFAKILLYIYNVLARSITDWMNDPCTSKTLEWFVTQVRGFIQFWHPYLYQYYLGKDRDFGWGRLLRMSNDLSACECANFMQGGTYLVL